MGIRALVKQILTEKENKRYRKELNSRFVSYETWALEREREIPQESNDCSEIAIFTLEGGRLSRCAEYLIGKYFAQHPEVQMVYGDEDVWERDIQTQAPGERKTPWFKPDWSPDLFDSYFFIGSVVAVRKELLEKCPYPVQSERNFVKWVGQCVEICGGRKKNCKSIGHIPEILFHCDTEEVLKRYLHWHPEVAAESGASPWGWQIHNTLSIIIPSKDNPEILQKCVDAIFQNVKNLNYELIIVDNGSSEENRQRIQDMLKESGICAIKYIYRPMEFNFSKMCNMGAVQAVGNLLLFLNDDVELCEGSDLYSLTKLATKEYVGAVGLKLYYPDSVRIQHAGITNLPMGPVHKLQFLEDSGSYYFDSNKGKRNVLAVTAACLMVEKQKFLEVKGFAEDLRVAFNDVDLCFKLHDAGYHNVCNNDCYAYHYESLSRGNDESTEKWQRLLSERERLYQRHPDLEGKDPYYGEGLGREGLDTRIRPSYEIAGNRIQKSECTRMKPEKVAECREDNCLLIRVENCQDGILQGYGVVLGDDNACYEKKLLLQNTKDSEIYGILIKGQYRPDLVENMPDQKNVGLSGFWVELEKPQENYRIGMMARNRITGLQLINWSNRYVQ